jgi:hypothetical protein
MRAHLHVLDAAHVAPVHAVHVDALPLWGVGYTVVIVVELVVSA